MPVLMILTVLLFDTAVCTIEIPKMLKKKLYRELWTFSVLLAIGTTLTIMKSLDLKIPNPNDLVMWVYSPFEGIFKSLLE